MLSFSARTLLHSSPPVAAVLEEALVGLANNQKAQEKLRVFVRNMFED